MKSLGFNSCNRKVAIHYENVPKAQFMPKAIHESISFNSRNREVAIHCGVARSDNPAHLSAKEKGMHIEKPNKERDSSNHAS